MEDIATFIGFIIALVVAIWVGRDASTRQTQTAPFLWGLGVFLLLIILLPLYLAKRPLKAGEVRSGGEGWNFMKNLAIVLTVYALVVGFLALIASASEATSAEDAAAMVVGLVLIVGFLWLILAGGALVLGLILKKSSVIERGPTGALAQTSGWSSAAPRTSEQPEARLGSYSNNVQSLGDGEHQGTYGELASIKEVVDLSPQQALDEAQTFLIRQGYRTMQRRGESLTMQRRSQDQTVGQNTLNLTVTALHQPEGGVRISVRGNDREGVEERQSAWMEWSESLPKKQEPQSTKAAEAEASTAANLDTEREAIEEAETASTVPSESSGDQQSDVYDQIRRLAELRDEGLLTSEEFEAKKRELLERL